MTNNYSTFNVDSILGLFNHELTSSDFRQIRSLFSEVRNSDCDDLALGVVNTLEDRIAKFSVPFCSERQACVLAYAVNKY